MDNLNALKANFIDSSNKFLNLVQKDNYQFNFVNKGLTKYGSKLKLGPACYGLKINYILGNTTNSNDFTKASKYINSFQKNNTNFPPNSFIDETYIKYFRMKNLNVSIKHKTKEILGATNFKPSYSKKIYIQKSIRAESKQAISTLFQIGSRNEFPYLDFPNTKPSISNFLNQQNWSLPWDAGAQFSGLCVFSSTQNYDNKKELKEYLLKDISKRANQENGFYYSGTVNSSSQLINGAMKVLSGLNWLDAEIHFPEKLIDSTLSIKPSSEGCDLVDAIYVLYQCSLQTNYKRLEIKEYFLEVINLIKLHQHAEGGFSYFLNKSQTHYYGLKVSKGLNEPDLHGTTLLMWAVAMVFNFIDENEKQLRTLKA